jgi:hypothetical protein
MDIIKNLSKTKLKTIINYGENLMLKKGQLAIAYYMLTSVLAMWKAPARYLEPIS